MHATHQIGQHRTLGIGNGVVVGVIDIAGADPPGPVQHHGIAGMRVEMQRAEMTGMPADQLQAAPGLLRVADRPGGIGGLALGPLDGARLKADNMGRISGGGEAWRGAKQQQRWEFTDHRLLPAGSFDGSYTGLPAWWKNKKAPPTHCWIKAGPVSRPHARGDTRGLRTWFGYFSERFDIKPMGAADGARQAAEPL